jgi:ferric-dicitrate binding protein FerR (iron transport regulator)
MSDQLEWDRLARYVSGEADAGERQEVERWASADPRNRATLDAAQRRWQASLEPGAWDVDRAWNRVQAKLHDRPPVVLPFAVPAGTSRAWLTAMRLIPLAAAAVIVLLVGIWKRDLILGLTDSAPQVATGSQVLESPVGEQRSFDLPDGSTVLLGAASTLRLDARFGVDSREVHLEGQAFLRVTHDAARPFVVIAGGTRTVDLGTAFEVRAYPSEAIRVVVTEGSVEVRREQGNAEPVAVLQAGDVARVGTGTADVLRQQDVDRLLGWMRGELSFNDAPLSEVARELERWFNVDCRIENQDISDLHLTVSFRIGESLEEILNVVGLALSSQGVRAERAGRTVTFRSGPPVSPTAKPTAQAEVGA